MFQISNAYIVDVFVIVIVLGITPRTRISFPGWNRTKRNGTEINMNKKKQEQYINDMYLSIVLNSSINESINITV